MDQLPFGMTTYGAGLALWFGFWYIIYFLWEITLGRSKAENLIDPVGPRIKFAVIAGLLSLPLCTIAIPIISELPILKPIAPAYTPPIGKSVTVICGIDGKGCDQPDYYKSSNDGFVKLWTTTDMTESKFERSTKAPACIASKSEVKNEIKFWWIDCGLFYGTELPVIEGWVPEENIKYWTLAKNG